MKNIINILLNIILVLVLFYSGYNIYFKLNDYNKSYIIYEEARNKNFDTLHDQNSEFKCWIRVDNTNIDYPVVQGNDNEYYLYKNFYKEDSKSGSIFIDYRNIDSDKNIILYGHNMKNKTMFNNLLKFKDESFFKENNMIRILKNDKEYIYEVFSAYTIDSGSDYLITNFPTPELFIDYLDDIQLKSIYKSDISLDESDKIITLSTCSYEFKDARTVVHAKLIDKKNP